MIIPCLATVQELQRALDKAKTTSVELVEQCLKHIEAHNHQGRNLHAIISVPSFAKATAIAAVLDNERRNGLTRGILHGIPIVINDNIMTSADLGMDTTGGSIALVGAKSSHNAALVERLLQTGVIILGKANMTEFAGLKHKGMTPGWSAVGGQTQSPFIDGGLKKGEPVLGPTAPAGSSTGSAVAVAAGFAPLAIGTETVASVILPAGRAGVYAFRAGADTIPMDGVLHLMPDVDMIGLFARCSMDLAELASCLLDKPSLLAMRPGLSWGEGLLTVAFADPREWNFHTDIIGDANFEHVNRQMVSMPIILLYTLSLTTSID